MANRISNEDLIRLLNQILSGPKKYWKNTAGEAKKVYDLEKRLLGNGPKGVIGQMDYSALPLNEVSAFMGPEITTPPVRPTSLQTDLQPGAPEYVLPPVRPTQLQTELQPGAPEITYRGADTRIRVGRPDQFINGPSQEPVGYRSPMEVVGLPQNSPTPPREIPPIQVDTNPQPMQPTYRPGVSPGKSGMGNIKLDPTMSGGNFSQMQSTVNYDPSLDPGAENAISPEDAARYQMQPVLDALQSAATRAANLSPDDPRYPTQQTFYGLSQALNQLLQSQSQSQQQGMINSQDKIRNQLLSGQFKDQFDANGQLPPDVAMGLGASGVPIQPWQIQGGYDPQRAKIDDAKSKTRAGIATRLLEKSVVANPQEAMDLADGFLRGSLTPSQERAVWDAVPELQGGSGTVLPSGGVPPGQEYSYFLKQPPG